MSQYNVKCEGAGLGYVQQAEVSVYPFVVSAMIARADPRTPADPTRLLRMHPPPSISTALRREPDLRGRTPPKFKTCTSIMILTYRITNPKK
jgi:hypothetical protein